MKLEVDFPTTGLPEDRELVGVRYKTPSVGDYYFYCGWIKSTSPALQVHLVAILKPKEVWLPCTPEDAFAKMLHPESRVIRTESFKTPVEKIGSINAEGRITFMLRGHNTITDAACPLEYFEVLKTKELS